MNQIFGLHLRPLQSEVEDNLYKILQISRLRTIDDSLLWLHPIPCLRDNIIKKEERLESWSLTLFWGGVL